jgi:hypothetical protein
MDHNLMITYFSTCMMPDLFQIIRNKNLCAAENNSAAQSEAAVCGMCRLQQLQSAGMQEN